MLAKLESLTTREKVILAVTVTLLLGAALHYTFLEGFFTRFNAVKMDLENARIKLEKQQRTLEGSEQINTRFEAIEQTISMPEDGRDPAKQFSEDMEAMFRKLRLPTPNFGRNKVLEIEEVDGFSYLVLPIQRIQGDLATITELLKRFAERNLLILSLEIQTVGPPLSRYLEMDVELAQIVSSDTLEDDTSRR